MTRNCLAAWFVLAGIAAVPTLTLAPAAAAQAIPDTVKSATAVDQISPPVQAFIREQVARLKGVDPAARSAARDALVAESGALSAPGIPAAGTAAYRDVYATLLNAELTTLFPAAPLEARLNAVIVAARVAPRDINAHLEGVAKAAITDKQDPVVLWGMKAGAQLLPASLSVRPANNALLAAISKSAAEHLTSTLVIDAYDALTLTSYSGDIRQLRDQIPDDRWRKLVPQVLPELYKVWQARLELYASGKAIDPSPERIPAVFVTSLRGNWQLLTPPQQLQAMQCMVNQLSLAGERATLAAGEKELFISTVYKSTAAALLVVGESERSDALQSAGRSAGALSGTAQPASIEQATAGVLSAARSIPKFAQLQPPPKAQTPSPTTTTTRPGG